jgi:hypothetical protein
VGIGWGGAPKNYILRDVKPKTHPFVLKARWRPGTGPGDPGTQPKKSSGLRPSGILGLFGAAGEPGDLRDPLGVGPDPVTETSD